MRPGRPGAFAAFVCAGGLAAVAAQAQVITGSLLGTVSDESGAVLPGAQITLSSPALVRGSVAQAANDRGQYRFPSLPPGLYTLRVEHKGFGAFLEEGMTVVLGGTAERNVSLKLATMAETVDVAAAGPLVDTNRVGLSTNITREDLDKIPLGRFSIYDLMKAAPGLSATRPSVGYNNDVSSFGAGIDENTFLLDGANATGPSFYGPITTPGRDAVQEIEVVSAGASAEYPHAPGAVFNVVTRQGDDHWRLDGSYYTLPPGLTAQPIRRECDCPAGQSGFERDQYKDLNVYFGGPILKDRLWLFGGYQRQRDSSTEPGADPRFPGKTDTYGFSAKLTWQINPRLRLVQAFHQDHYAATDSPTVSYPFATLVTYEGDGRSVTLADLSFQARDDTLLELRVSGFLAPGSSANPNSGSRSLPFHYDLSTGVASGGSYLFGHSTNDRFSAQAKLSRYAEEFLSARHDFRFGVQYDKGSSESVYGYPGGAYYYDYAGQPYSVFLRNPSAVAAEVDGLGVFAQDVARVGERLTLSLGLRYDRDRATNRDVAVYDKDGIETGDVVPGQGTLYTSNTWSPRLGFTYKLSRDGRTVARGQWGRFHPALFTRAVENVHPGITPITEAYFDPETGGYTNVASITDPIRNIGIDPRIRSPVTDQLSIGLDRQLPAEMVFGVNYIRKDGRAFTGWRDVGGVYGTETTTLEDGRVLPVYPLQNSPSDRLFLLTNPSGWFLRYDGLLLTLQKRWSRKWQAFVSYSFSKARGLLGSSGRGPFGGQFSDGARSGFGRDPNDLTNATGNLANDRTHMLRVQGAWEVPKIGVLVGVHFQQLTGKPWAGLAVVRLPQGARAIFVEPRGSRRISSQSLLDLRLSKALRFRQARLEVLLDVLNALNEQAEENVVSSLFFSPNFAEGARFVEPRRVMLGVRFGFEAKR